MKYRCRDSAEETGGEEPLYLGDFLLSPCFLRGGTCFPQLSTSSPTVTAREPVRSEAMHGLFVLAAQL